MSNQITIGLTSFQEDFYFETSEKDSVIHLKEESGTKQTFFKKWRWWRKQLGF
jgi:hypothetical protein